MQAHEQNREYYHHLIERAKSCPVRQSIKSTIKQQVPTYTVDHIAKVSKSVSIALLELDLLKRQLELGQTKQALEYLEGVNSSLLFAQLELKDLGAEEKS